MTDGSSNSGISLPATSALIITSFAFFLLNTYLPDDGGKISEFHLVFCSVVFLLTFGIAGGSICINSVMSTAMRIKIGTQHVFASGYVILEPFIDDDFTVNFVFPVVFALILTVPIPYLLSFKLFSAVIGAQFLLTFAIVRMSMSENKAVSKLIIKVKSLPAKVITGCYSLTHSFWDKMKYVWDLIYNTLLYTLDFARTFVFREVKSLPAKVITECSSLTHSFWDKMKYVWDLIYNPLLHTLDFASAFVFREVKSLPAKVITECYSLTHSFWDKMKYVWDFTYNPLIYTLNIASTVVFKVVIFFANANDWSTTFALFLLGMLITFNVIGMALYADAETYWRNSNLMKRFGKLHMVIGCILLVGSWSFLRAFLATAAGVFLYMYADSVEDPPQCKAYAALVHAMLTEMAAEYAKETEREEKKKKKNNRHKPKEKKNF